jgi:hypothetical protein
VPRRSADTGLTPTESSRCRRTFYAPGRTGSRHACRCVQTKRLLASPRPCRTFIRTGRAWVPRVPGIHPALRRSQAITFGKEADDVKRADADATAKEPQVRTPKQVLAQAPAVSRNPRGIRQRSGGQDFLPSTLVGGRPRPPVFRGCLRTRMVFKRPRCAIRRSVRQDSTPSLSTRRLIAHDHTPR